MNQFFGVISEKKIHFDKFEKKAAVMYGQDVVGFVGEHGNVFCGYQSNDGAILGCVEDDGDFFIYVGNFYAPYPSPVDEVPLDRPHEIARGFLHCYRKKGKAFMDNVRGAYAFFLYDQKKRKAIIGTDPDGMRQVFVSNSSNKIYFTTMLASMNCFGKEGVAVDRSFEDFLLGYEFLPFKRTLYKNVYRLNNGDLLSYENNAVYTSKVNFDDKKTIPDECIDLGTEDKIVDRLYQSLCQTIEELCPKNSPIAVLLGGVDSALIAALLKEKGYDVETFTFYFDDHRYNQAHVDTLRNYLDIKHNWVPIDIETIRKGVEQYALTYNQVTSLPHYLIETTTACNLMREKGFLHCLTGDGCDELFFGYPSVYKRARLFMGLGDIPASVLNTLHSLFGVRWMEKWFGHPARFIRNFIKIAQRRGLERGHISNRTLDGISLRRLRVGSMPRQAVDIETILSTLVIGLENYSALRLAYHGKAMPGLNKAKHEGASNASGVLVNSPFIHPRIKSLAQRLPEHLLRSPEETSESGKYIFLKMIDKYNILPSEIVYQKKASPVASPVDGWYSTLLNEFIIKNIEYLPFEYNRDYIDALLRPKAAEKWFRHHISIGSYTSNAVAVLVTYAAFAKYAKSARVCAK